MRDWDYHGTGRSVRDIDSMARAAFVWVRQQSFQQRFIGLPVSSAEETALAAGFLAGLSSRLRLRDSESTLVAYVYVLMNGERAGAPQTAEHLIQREPASFAPFAGYLRGREAAREFMREGADKTSSG